MRINMPREFFKPKDYVLLQADEALGVEIYRDPVRCVAMAFSGKRTKPDWHYRFRSEELLAARVSEFVEGLKKRAEEKAANRKEAKEWKHSVKVGDIFRSSWGYDQTNIDYYEVTKIIGKSYVEIREINQLRVETLSMQGECVPAPGSFATEPDYTQEKIDGAYPRKLKETRRVKVQKGFQGAPYIRVRSFATAGLHQPIEVAPGVKVFAPDHWTAYA